MKNKKNILIVFIFISLITLSILLFLNKKNIKDYQVEDENKSEIIELTENKQIQEQIEIKSPPVALDKIKDKELKVFLFLLDKKYDISIAEGDSVFVAMKKIKENSNNDSFDFTYTETPGMGSFITGINGQTGSPGKYWIYYINNIKASIGVSQYILKEGDIINWKQEGL